MSAEAPQALETPEAADDTGSAGVPESHASSVREQPVKSQRQRPVSASKKTSAPLPDPHADRMSELLAHGYGHEPRGTRSHVQKVGTGAKNHDSLSINNAGLVVTEGKGLCVNESVDTGAGRGVPTVGAEPPLETRPSKGSHLSRGLTDREPPKTVPCLKVDPTNEMRQSHIFRPVEKSESPVILDVTGRPLSGKKAVANKLPDNMGVGKELPLESHPKLLKHVETPMKTSLKCGAVEPEVLPSPPKPNSGPMMSSLGSAEGGLIPVRHHNLKLKKSDDETPEGEPETWDPKYKTAGFLWRQPAPFACGTQLGGGFSNHKPCKKIDKKAIGIAPYAVGEAAAQDNASEKLAQVKRCPFGVETDKVGAKDTMSEDMAKQRITKSLKPKESCPFAVGETITGEVNSLDAAAGRSRITKQNISKEAPPSPFARIDSNSKVDPNFAPRKSGAPVKQHHQRREAPFAVGGIMEGNHKHMPKGAPAPTAAVTPPTSAPAEPVAAAPSVPATPAVAAPAPPVPVA